MFNGTALAESIKMDTHFFLNEVKQFYAADADYRPKPEMFSVREQVLHVAQVLDWFREAGWGGGFDMDFSAAQKRLHAAGTLDDAVAELKAATARMVDAVKDLTADQLGEILPDNPILGAVPKFVLIGSCKDHSAHHRGSLAVYLRLLGKTPKLPYAD